jgi:hypothetical protein
MFEDLYDNMSLIFSHWWPAVFGEITAIDVERIRQSGSAGTLRLAVAYEFSIGDDGPYTGESFWQPWFFVNRRIRAAKHNIHHRQRVMVRYRPDNPSVNKLDPRIWRSL